MLAFIEIFYQKRFINEYARKKKAKILESQSFLVRYRRTYVLKKQSLSKNLQYWKNEWPDGTIFILYFDGSNNIFEG